MLEEENLYPLDRIYRFLELQPITVHLACCSSQTLTGSLLIALCCCGPFYSEILPLRIRYLFNCGENTVRILHELNRLKMNISQVFLTGITWQNHIAGLPTLIKCHSSSRESALSIYGPEGITKFLKDVSTFSSTGLQRYQALKLFTSTEFICNSAQYQQDPYIDDNITILPVIFERKDQDVSFSERQSICYICEFADLPGQFLLDKAVKLGVTEESFNELAIGNPVLSSYGRKVDPSEVLSLSTPGQVFMIVDCPSVEIRDHLVHSSEFSQFYSSSGSKTPHVIIHLTPFEIFESESYKMWMDEFGKDTTHIVINKQVVNQGTPFLRSIAIQSALSVVDSDIFPPIAETTVPTECHSISNNCIPAETLMTYQFRPLNMEGLTTRNLRHGYGAGDLLRISQEASEKLGDEVIKSVGTSSVTSKEENLQTMVDSKVTFLGTGYAIPSYGRGQSAILVHTKDDRSILLDCGEGTYSQLHCLYKEHTADVVASLRCVFISHRHPDHHMGLMQLILEYGKQVEERQLPYLPVIGPWRLFQWLKKHSKLMGKDLPIRFLPFGEVKSNVAKDEIQKILEALDLNSLEVVSVLHTRDSNGIVLNHSSGWKLVYSGDCVPSYNLIRKGKNATLLIHEATYYEIPKDEPIRGRHCTLAEAIKVSRDMDASYTILTHFSKRWKNYWPRETGNLRLGPGISTAFDFMTVRFSDLPRLHKLRPAIAKVFEKPPDKKTTVRAPTPREQRIFRRERNQELFKMLF
ncbi:zinc phosphodiesterase ELAC protein 2-like isoform X2 [Montipora capricornis]|uniref:zinc phosphodiesterase ELAC protein 2-like isoform X2 n=1 Tax=Montipora capricornis TaxID=246305 RepID=UPI0035F134B9